MFLLEPLGESLFPCLFHLMEAACVTWLLATFHPQSQQRPIKPFSPWPTLTLSHPDPLWFFCFLFPHLKDPYDYVGYTWIIQDNLFSHQFISNLNSIWNLNSRFPYNIIYSQVLGIRAWIFVGWQLFCPAWNIFPFLKEAVKSCFRWDIWIFKCLKLIIIFFLTL